mmetsp:Transcript_12821/g.44347  ORF Transcript_12821/g.44347 Transcript_12821/m.44347 type:complete len:282 (-) Transcript_12821:1940-2785(-)
MPMPRCVNDARRAWRRARRLPLGELGLLEEGEDAGIELIEVLCARLNRLDRLSNLAVAARQLVGGKEGGDLVCLFLGGEAGAGADDGGLHHARRRVADLGLVRVEVFAVVRPRRVAARRRGTVHGHGHVKEVLQLDCRREGQVQRPRAQRRRRRGAEADQGVLLLLVQRQLLKELEDGVELCLAAGGEDELVDCALVLRGDRRGVAGDEKVEASARLLLHVCVAGAERRERGDDFAAELARQVRVRRARLPAEVGELRGDHLLGQRIERVAHRRQSVRAAA